MSFRKDKKIMSSEKDFSFKPGIGITHQRPPTIKIGFMSENSSASSSSTKREDKIVSQEASNLKGQLRLPRKS
jgi:hypothetical protein